MSLGEAYTLGVKLTGDITSLRAELAAGKQVVTEFSAAAVESMNRAAAAMERGAAAMEKSSNRTTRSTEKVKKPLVSASQGFDDYMRRATAAQERVAQTSESTSDRTSRSLGNVGSALTRLTGGLGFALLAKQVWDTGLGFATFQQNTQIALTSLLGSGAAAKTFLADILAFAKQTPYAFTDLTEQAQKLITWGFDAQQVIPILRSIGDAATTMGKGKDGIDRIVLALGQINTKGRLQAQELLQLSEVGVNGLKILANQAGISTLEYQKLISDGLVPADQAIAGLVKGLNEGTTGVNGTTVAFGGMMEKIKGAGGITATLDSANTSFRNMSGALVQDLLPTVLSLVRVGTSGMSVIKGWANTFGDLPDPVRQAAIAFAALTVANRVLNTQARVTGVWTALTSNFRASAAAAEAMGTKVTVARTAMIAVRSTASTVGRSLLGAFGGGVGLAITGVVAAISAFAGAQSAAKAKSQELRDSLDQTTAAITEQTRALVYDEIVASDRYERIAGLAERIGISMQEVVDIAVDPTSETMAGLNRQLEANAAVLEKAGASNDRYSASNDRTRRQSEDITDLLSEIGRSTSDVTEEQEALRLKIAAVGTEGEVSLTAVGDAYSAAASKVREFTEEEEKAIAAAGDAAFKAAQTNLGARSLNLATEDDIAAAREKVADATEKVSDAEADRDDKAARRKVSARDKAKAEEAVADARKALQEATADLAKTEERADPVKQYREQVQAIIDASQSFVSDIQALADKGLNASDLASIIAAGPEGSADTRKALLSDDALIGFTNDARGLIDTAAATAQQQAQIVKIALQDAGSGMGADIALGMRIAAEQGSVDTVTALAEKLGQNPQTIYDVGTQLGLSFLAGFSDAAKFNGDVWKNALSPTGTQIGTGTVLKPRGMYNGGIYPGYSPGRDIGYIGISGGEAVMRPEWTRAVGPGYVHHMNAIARTMGVTGVQAEMRRYLGGFAGGGIPGGTPSVVTVPVSSTHERYSPVTVQKAYVVDARSLGIYGDRTGAQRNKFGGNRG